MRHFILSRHFYSQDFWFTIVFLTNTVLHYTSELHGLITLVHFTHMYVYTYTYIRI